jgi:preprotein translocase subunit SecA
LTNASQVEAFRAYVTKRPDIFPESQQPELIAQMKRDLKTEELTKRSISEYLQGEFVKKDAFSRQIRELNLKADESMSIVKAVDNAIAGVRQRATDFRKACVKLNAVLNDPRQGERAYRDVMGDRRLRHELETASRALTSILDGLGQQTSIRTIETKDFIEG